MRSSRGFSLESGRPGKNRGERGRIVAGRKKQREHPKNREEGEKGKKKEEKKKKKQKEQKEEKKRRRVGRR